MWIAIAAVVLPMILGFVGWIFNSLITNKIHDLKEENRVIKKEIEALHSGITDKAKEGFQTVFRRIDQFKESADNTFVRMDNYNIAREYQDKASDEKFKSLLSIMNTQFQSVEDKIDALRALVESTLTKKQG